MLREHGIEREENKRKNSLQKENESQGTGTPKPGYMTGIWFMLYAICEIQGAYEL